MQAITEEFTMLAVRDISDWTENPRQSMSEAGLEDLTASVRRHGVLQPILVRPLTGLARGYLCIAGARRLAAARLAGLTEVPVRVLDLSEDAAEEVAIIENLQREDMAPLDEGRSYQRLLDTGRHIDDVAAAVGKSKAYVYQRLSLLRLTPHAQDLLEGDALPLSYALKLATLSPEKQEPALRECYRPLYGDEAWSRQWLEPIGKLQAWIDKHAKLEPQSEDVQVLLPELAAQLEAATATEDGGQAPSVLALSTLHFHTDKSEPRPILVNSWKRADGSRGAPACSHAQPGVIVLGEGRGTLLTVCAAKKACKKHWPPKSRPASSGASRPDRKAAREREEARWKKEEEARERWRTVGRGVALRLAHEQLADILWDPRIIELLFERVGYYAEVEPLMGSISSLHNNPDDIPRAVALALLAGRSWDQSDFVAYAKRLGLPLTSKDITAAVAAVTPADTPAPTKKTKKATR